MRRLFLVTITSLLLLTTAGSASAQFIENRKCDQPGLLNRIGCEAGFVENRPVSVNESTIATQVCVFVGFALSFVGIVFVILMVYGGYLWMTAGGNEDQVTRARQYMTNGVIGIIVIFASYAISFAVISTIQGGLQLTGS